MGLYKELINSENRANELIEAIKNRLFHNISDAADNTDVAVKVVSNRAVSDPIITIIFEDFTFWFIEDRLTFDITSEKNEFDLEGFNKLQSTIKTALSNVFNSRLE